ncbi:MAG: HDOD domain-containing protein [Candidatus Riflebacteria bacterium]|nr:HDOD domain-containing protein [Candidatus Riflebacteria bacterium]
MSDKQPFQARDYGNGTLEIITVFPGMTSDHPAISALPILGRKFKNLIFTLEPGASLEVSGFAKLIELSSVTRLKVVTTEPDAHPYLKAGIFTFPRSHEAFLAIKGDEVTELILAKMETIPELNTQAYELLQKLGKPETTFDKLGEIIVKEPGLAAQILKTANSAFFMRRTQADTIQTALSVLGMEGLKQILIVNVFKGLTGYFGAQKEILDHGRACAHLGSHLAELGKVPKQNLGKIKLGGLLHDIGSLALVFYFPKEYAEVRNLIKTQSKRSYEAESIVFGVEHQRLGKLLAQKWGFPDYLCYIIGDHHDLRESSWEELTSPVFCANGFINQTIENVPFTPYYQKLRSYFAHLGGEKMTISDLQDALKKEYEKFQATPPTGI